MIDKIEAVEIRTEAEMIAALNRSHPIQCRAEITSPFEASDCLDWESLAREYESRCEAFDREACSSWDANGCGVPLTGKELGQIGNNAREVMKDICRREKISESELQRAVSIFIR